MQTTQELQLQLLWSDLSKQITQYQEAKPTHLIRIQCRFESTLVDQGPMAESEEVGGSQLIFFYCFGMK